ncbi:hypothetical protein [Ekhidna sp. To15]|uniref:hypothetical protein n=1 Tax=Ekhidna sp. To15 TaxID=3395267 RepID=UPI003F51FFD0
MKIDVEKTRKFANEYNRASFNASLIIIPLFFILFFWTRESESHCSSLKEDMDKKFEFLKNPDAIMEMKIKKLAYQYANNLVDYELTINDPIILEEIRQMIRNRNRSEWNRSQSKWEAIMSLKLYSGDTLEIEVVKLDGGKPGETHLNFLFGECSYGYPSYSRKLGDYLEQLVK